MEMRYSNTARIVAVACLILASVTYVIGQMKGIGVAFGSIVLTVYYTDERIRKEGLDLEVALERLAATPAAPGSGGPAAASQGTP